MNLQDLFEKSEVNDKEDEQSIDIRDPATKWLVKKARAKYAYAETDLEAFVQFMRDEVDAEKERIQSNTDNIDKEHDINITQKGDIDREHKMNLHQEKVNNSQERHIKELEKIVDKFDDVRKDMDMKIGKLDKATLQQ